MGAISKARVDLEKLYSQRIEDSAVDLPENAAYKEDCVKSLRNSEAAFTSYAGSVRSIKGVLETLLNKQYKYKLEFRTCEYTIVLYGLLF